MNFYYVFGMQRSGTNFLEQLLKMNYGAKKRNATTSAWKHSIDDPTEGWQKKLPTIIIHKNPYAWVESIATRNTVDWLKTQKTYPADEEILPIYKLGPKNMNVVNLAKTYRHFHMNWLGRTDIPNYGVIRYEDLLVDDKRYKILLQFNEKFGWHKPANDRFRIPSRGSVSQSKDYNEEREKYYLDFKPKELTQIQIEAINETIGEDLITKMGYDIL